jgi:AcrR family transcriptional regulator
MSRLSVMKAARRYPARRRLERGEQTRERIVGAVRALLADGHFHQSTMEEVAERAGVSRATLYQHFRSRLDLVEPICDTFDRNPALLRLRGIVELPDGGAALAEWIACVVEFWSSEEAVLRQLYGVVAVDPAARDLVERQWRDRRGEVVRMIRKLDGSGELRKGQTEESAVALLLVLSSFETYLDLRREGLDDARIGGLLREAAQTLVWSGGGVEAGRRPR